MLERRYPGRPGGQEYGNAVLRLKHITQTALFIMIGKHNRTALACQPAGGGSCPCPTKYVRRLPSSMPCGRLPSSNMMTEVDWLLDAWLPPAKPR